MESAHGKTHSDLVPYLGMAVNPRLRPNGAAESCGVQSQEPTAVAPLDFLAAARAFKEAFDCAALFKGSQGLGKDSRRIMPTMGKLNALVPAVGPALLKMPDGEVEERVVSPGAVKGRRGKAWRSSETLAGTNDASGGPQQIAAFPAVLAVP